MKNVISTLLFSVFLISATFAQPLPGKNPLALKFVSSPTQKRLMAFVNQLVQQNNGQHKTAVKMPELIYTRLWDGTTNSWKDTLEKYVLVWDNQKKLQSIIDYTYDTTGTGGNTRSILSGFITVDQPMQIDNNLTINMVPSSTISQTMQKGKWVNSDKQGVILDKNGRISTMTEQTWTNNKWMDNIKLNITYDSLGNFQSYVAYENLGTAFIPVEGIKEQLTFNKSGFITEVLQSMSQGGHYTYNVKESFVLNSKGEITSALLSTYDTIAKSWNKNDSIYNVTWLKFNPALRLNYETGGTFGMLAIGGDKYLGYTTSKLDAPTQSWAIPEKSSYTYNSDNLPVYVLTQNYTNNTWVNNTCDSTTYYNGGDIKTYTDKYWSNGWHNTSMGKNNINTYDNDNDIKTAIVQNPDPIVGAKFYNYSLTEYFYQSNSAVEPETANNSTIHVFPNPAAGQLFISAQNIFDAEYTVSVSDMTGKPIIVEKLNAHNTNNYLDISVLKNGMYFLIMNDGKKTFSEKIIKN